METSLHRSLKEHYGLGSGGRVEVAVGGYRIDALGSSGQFVEVQNGPLRLLRRKLATLLPNHDVCVVKPVIIRRRLVRRSSAEGIDFRGRLSPRVGNVVDAFGDLVGIARLFPHPRLSIEVVALTIEEIRSPRLGRRGYAVVDRRLDRILGVTRLAEPRDLWKLLPASDRWEEPFTSRTIATVVQRPAWYARQVAYCLRVMGAAEVMRRERSGIVYQKTEASCLRDRVRCHRGRSNSAGALRDLRERYSSTEGNDEHP